MVDDRGDELATVMAQDDRVTGIDWPTRWQAEAKEALQPFFGLDVRLRIVVDDPATAIDGTVVEGFVYLDGSVPTVIHDHSGRSDVYPWRLLAGPVLRIYEPTPRRKPRIVYAHPGWQPRHSQ
ncbi:MAG: hypothetical protein ACRDO1_08280 [Nocardioidaceae bacterium]